MDTQRVMDDPRVIYAGRRREGGSGGGGGVAKRTHLLREPALTASPLTYTGRRPCGMVVQTVCVCQGMWGWVRRQRWRSLQPPCRKALEKSPQRGLIAPPPIPFNPHPFLSLDAETRPVNACVCVCCCCAPTLLIM